MTNKIAHVRKGQGMSQAQLAAKIGLSVVALQSYEYGKVSPKIDTVEKLMNALNCEFWDLFCRKE